MYLLSLLRLRAHTGALMQDIFIDELKTELRMAKSSVATMRAQMETIRMRAKQREKVFTDALNPKIDKARRQKLLDMLYATKDDIDSATAITDPYAE